MHGGATAALFAPFLLLATLLIAGAAVDFSDIPLLDLLTNPKGALLAAAILALARVPMGERRACLDASLRRTAPLLLLIGAASAFGAVLTHVTPIGALSLSDAGVFGIVGLFALTALFKLTQGSSMATFAAIAPVAAPLVGAMDISSAAAVLAICCGSFIAILPNDSYYWLVRDDRPSSPENRPRPVHSRRRSDASGADRTGARHFGRRFRRAVKPAWRLKQPLQAKPFQSLSKIPMRRQRSAALRTVLLLVFKQSDGAAGFAAAKVERMGELIRPLDPQCVERGAGEGLPAARLRAIAGGLVGRLHDHDAAVDEVQRQFAGRQNGAAARASHMFGVSVSDPNRAFEVDNIGERQQIVRRRIHLKRLTDVAKSGGACQGSTRDVGMRQSSDLGRPDIGISPSHSAPKRSCGRQDGVSARAKPFPPPLPASACQALSPTQVPPCCRADARSSTFSCGRAECRRR